MTATVTFELYSCAKVTAGLRLVKTAGIFKQFQRVHFQLAGNSAENVDDPENVNYVLPISKLRGVPPSARMALKARHITTCCQLLAAAADFDDRQRLSRDSRIPLELLSTIVRRADMARIEGIGAVFGLMLEELDVLEVSMLAKHDPQTLHDRLRAHNPGLFGSSHKRSVRAGSCG